MKLHELLAKVGSNYGIQMLQNCIKGAKEKKRPHKHTEVTFLTEEMTPNDLFREQPNSKVGIIVWVDKQAYLDAVNSENENA